MTDALHRLAEAQHGVVSLAQALDAGLSRKQIACRLARGDFEAPFPGALLITGSPQTFEQQVMAGVLAAGPGAAASHRAAATLLGFPGLPRWVEVLVRIERRPRIQGLVVHRTRAMHPRTSAVSGGSPPPMGHER